MDLKDWDALKRRYPKTYEPKYSACTTCANFADLIQKSGETINDYHLRVQTAYKRLTDSKPTRHEQDSRQSPYQSGKILSHSGHRFFVPGKTISSTTVKTSGRALF
jgi:hypothetical protein